LLIARIDGGSALNRGMAIMKGIRECGTNGKDGKNGIPLTPLCPFRNDGASAVITKWTKWNSKPWLNGAAALIAGVDFLRTERVE
jgi:hypothetical protein